MRHLVLGAAVATVAAWMTTRALADDGAAIDAATRNKIIARQIASNIDSSGQLSNYHFDVAYQNGVASLIGRVASEQQRAAALQIAQNSNGVLQVIDELTVVPPASKPAATAPAQVAAGRASAGGETPAVVSHLKQGFSKITSIKQQAPIGASATPLRAGSAAGNMAAMPAPDAEGAVTRTTAVAREPTPEQLAYQQQLALRQHMAAQQAYHQQIYQQQAYQQQMAAGQQQGSGGAMPAGYALAAPLAAPAMLAQQAGFGQPMPAQMPGPGGRAMPVSYDQPHMPNYAWPAYAPQNNYSRVTYPKEYSPTAWPFIGPFYPYPQVPLGWRKVTLEWDDGWWRLKFRHHRR